MTQMNGYDPAEHAAIPPPPPGFVREAPDAPTALQAMPEAELKALVDRAVDKALSTYARPAPELKPSGLKTGGSLAGHLHARLKSTIAWLTSLILRTTG